MSRQLLHLSLLFGLLSFWGVTAPQAKAHPLDEFYQATFIAVGPNRVSLTVELYAGVLIAPKVIELIDKNLDDVISEEEAEGYAQLFLDDLTFEVSSTPEKLYIANVEISTPLDLRAGVGVVHFDLYADLPAAHRGENEFFYENNHYPDSGVYLVNALSDDPQWVQIQKQERDVFQKSLRVSYTIDPEAPVGVGPEKAVADVEAPGGISESQKKLTAFLYDTDASPLFLIIVIASATLLGGLHALTPGHGKTLVAAYLIGNQGTVRHAMFLGGVVTFTHTASVIVIGLLALLASQFIVPNILTPALEIASGLLVVYLGVQLLRARWSSYRKNPTPAEPPNHMAPDDHAHAHRHGLPHHHHHDDAVKLGDLLTLGISGGLVPCPEALGIMLIAVGLNRILLGLGMVVAFSFGLAGVLIVIGILLVRAKSVLDRFGGTGRRWQTLLPLISAVIVTLLGLGILFKGLMPFIRL